MTRSKPLNDNQVRITQAAEKTFGDSDFARKWLTLPNPVLNNRIPLEVTQTDAGVHEVEGALSQFAHGDYI